MRVFFVIAILMFVQLLLQAQNEWSLEQCINHALNNNLNIKQQRIYTNISENNLQSSIASRFPSLNAGGNHNYSFGRTVDPFTNEFAEENVSSSSFSASSSWNLFSGFQQHYNIKKNRADLNAATAELEQVKNNIMLLIVSSYLNILYNYELLDIAQLQLEITELQLNRTRKLVESGSLPIQNLLEIEAQKANEDLNIVNFENNLSLSLLNLAQIIEVENSDNFYVLKPDIDNIHIEAVAMSVDQIYREAIHTMPQIESAECRTESAYMSLMVAKGARYPRLNLSASYGTGYSNARKMIQDVSFGDPYISGFVLDDNYEILHNVYQFATNYSFVTRPFSDQIKDNASAAVGFSLSIPIFNGWQIKSNVNNSRLLYDQSIIQLTQAKKDLYKDIQQAHADAEAAVKKYYATQKTLEAMQKSFEYMQQRFDVGLLNSVDYNIAKNNLTRTQSELVRAKYDFIFKQKILDFYRGVQIKL